VLHFASAADGNLQEVGGSFFHKNSGNLQSPRFYIRVMRQTDMYE
jgi:hypothetical protein